MVRVSGTYFHIVASLLMVRVSGTYFHIVGSLLMVRVSKKNMTTSSKSQPTRIAAR